MGRLARPRSDLRSSRKFQAGFGARHPIINDEGVAAFFYELSTRWNAILPEREPEMRRLAHLPEHRFSLYDNPEKIGITVLERRLSEVHARRYRIKWSPNDVGRIRGQIQDEIDRLEIDPEDPGLKLTTPIRVGDADRRTRGGKFALIPEAGNRLAGLLAAEHEIVVRGLSGVLKEFRYPYSEYVPKMTIGHIYRDASPEQVDACAQELTAMLGEAALTVSLKPIAFFDYHEM